MTWWEVIVVQPRLDAAGVALDVLLVGDVLVVDQEEVLRALHLALAAGPGKARGHGLEDLSGHCGARVGKRLPAVVRRGSRCVRDVRELLEGRPKGKRLKF